MPTEIAGSARARPQSDIRGITHDQVTQTDSAGPSCRDLKQSDRDDPDAVNAGHRACTAETGVGNDPRSTSGARLRTHGESLPADGPPPVAVLTVFDDGKTDGEIIRIRDHRFVIGRTEGDLCIPLDGRISARHVEITHQVVGGLHRWVVTDLQSTHGMFVRVSRTVLADKAEFLVGNGRYRFDAPQADAGRDGRLRRRTSRASAKPTAGTTAPSPFRPPALTELLGSEIGNRILLVKNEYWIGSDPSCPICRPDDPFCEPRHVRLYRGGSRGLARRAQQDAERPLAADVADHRRIDGPVPDRRATVSAQGEVIAHGNSPQIERGRCLGPTESIVPHRVHRRGSGRSGVGQSVGHRCIEESWATTQASQKEAPARVSSTSPFPIGSISHQRPSAQSSPWPLNAVIANSPCSP